MPLLTLKHWTNHSKYRILYFSIFRYCHILKILPCWQIAPWTNAMISGTVSRRFLLNLFKNVNTEINTIYVNNIVSQTSNVNGWVWMLVMFDNLGRLNNILLLWKKCVFQLCPIRFRKIKKQINTFWEWALERFKLSQNDCY